MSKPKIVASVDALVAYAFDKSPMPSSERSSGEVFALAQTHTAPFVGLPNNVEFSGDLIMMNQCIEHTRFFNAWDQVARSELLTNGRVGLCSRVAINYSVSTARFVEDGAGLSAQRLRDVIDYVRSNLHLSLGVTQIARIAFISPYYFGKLFKRSTGQTVHQYVLDQRVRRAQFLLSTTHMTLSEIASSVGLSNQSHFTTVFRTKLGVTPGYFRVRSKSFAQKMST
jgi:AraC-like DNA-binding protein